MSKEFNDKYDILKHIFSVHSKIKKEGIKEDYLLFEATEKDIQFIREQFKIARHLRTFVRDTETAEKIYRNLMAEAELIVILQRNKEKNKLVNDVITENKKEKENEVMENESIAGKIKNIIKKQEKD